MSDRRSYKRKWIQSARALKKQSRCLETDQTEYESTDSNEPIPSCSGTSERIDFTDNHEQDVDKNYEVSHSVHSEQSMQLIDNSQNKVSEWDFIDEHIIIDSDMEDEGDNLDQPSLCDDLSLWVNENNITHNATDQLLKIMQSHGMTEVPSTARSLMKTKRIVDVVMKAGMQYFYFGLEAGFLTTLNRFPSFNLENVDQISISFNIDGLPLFKSTKTSLWPILCGIHIESFPVQIFPVALSLGQNKPNNLNFMDEFIMELNQIVKDGFLFENRNLGVKIRTFICDAPAKCMIKGIKLYSGYFGCDRCTQRGVWHGRMTYQETDNLILRTDLNFRNKGQEQHHNQNTPLTNLRIDMIKSFPIDYMHQTCLGVMKRLLLIWLRGKREVKISVQHKDEISRNLVQLRKFIPELFARKPRTLDEIDRWKATEYRQFLLYTGKIVLKSVLRCEFYSHFLTFSVAICILVCPEMSKNYQAYAKDLLKYFVLQGRVLYGPEFLVYNVHSLLHIADDVKEHGHLDNFSAFPYENYMQKLKKNGSFWEKSAVPNSKKII